MDRLVSSRMGNRNTIEFDGIPKML